MTALRLCLLMLVLALPAAPTLAQEPPSSLPPSAVLMGASTMHALCKYPQYAPPNSMNLALGGSRADMLAAIAPTAVAFSPAKIFIMSGTNDVNFNPPEHLAGVFDWLLRYFAVLCPDTTVYVISIQPVNRVAFSPPILATNAAIPAYNDHLRAVTARHPNAEFVDIAARFADADGNLDPALTIDGLHLNEKGYALWHSLLKDRF